MQSNRSDEFLKYFVLCEISVQLLKTTLQKCFAVFLEKHYPSPVRLRVIAVRTNLVSRWGEAMQQLYEAIVGERSKAYYLPRFEQYDQQAPGLKAGWNWPAFFFGGVWALYRKMYGWFFAFWGIAILSNIFEEAGSPELGAIIFIGSWIAFTIYANSLYHSSVKKKISIAQLSVQDEPKLLELLHYKGGVHTWIIWVFGMLPVIGILAAIAIPAYHDYTVRSKTAGIQKSPANQVLNSPPASRSHPQNDLTASGKRAWSGNVFDQFDSVEDIERRARKHDPRLNDPRAWDAVRAWQHWDMRDTKREANVALYIAVDNVLEGLKGGKGICRPGNVITFDAAHAGKDFPAGTEFVSIDCDQ